MIVDGEKASSPNFVGFVFQGKAYEGLTCDALEWIASSGGGTIVDSSGKVTVNNPQAAAMLNKAKGWIGTISRRASPRYAGGRRAHRLHQRQRGLHAQLALCVLVWAAATTPSVKGKFDVAPLPAQSGSKHSGTIGGWGMAVSRTRKRRTRRSSSCAISPARSFRPGAPRRRASCRPSSRSRTSQKSRPSSRT